MEKRMLVGVDSRLSPPTRHALQVTSEWLQQCSPRLGVVVLHVLAAPLDTRRSRGPLLSVPITGEEREQGEHALQQARALLMCRGIASARIETFLREGAPVAELAKAARDLGVDLIVIGSRGASFKQRLRRTLVGSVSRSLLQVAPCPVLLAILPAAVRPQRLADWYELAVTQYLQDRPRSFCVFTPGEVAQQFVPPPRERAGRKEIEAATQALLHLGRLGVLCCSRINGMWYCRND